MKMQFNKIQVNEVFDTVSKVMRPFGQQLVLDLEKSHGCYIHDSLKERDILDIFSFFATNALGHNHPKIVDDEQFNRELLLAAQSNPSNSDFYTTQYANFIAAFRQIAMPAEFKYAFFISGGTLAVENGLKVAMDWKIEKNKLKGKTQITDMQVLHFNEAFHGRSGYTLSLTNTKPVDIHNFAKFKWPRVDNPKIHFPLDAENAVAVEESEKRTLAQIQQEIKNNGDEICAIIIEPIQSEGGDNHFRKEFFVALRDICDRHEILLIFDEVQTGVGLSGKFWAYQHFDVVPDILCFGKKMNVCGIMSTARVDEVKDNCFTVDGRINSTWGGSLADMVHATKVLRIIEEDKLVENAAKQGEYILTQLKSLQQKTKIDNVRGRGLQCAFDLPTTYDRDALIKKALDKNLLLLGAGERSIRFRPALVIQREEIDECMRILEGLVGGD